MRIYISCHHPDPANELAAALTVAGHEIASTWHTDTAPRPDRDDANAWAQKANDNFEQIAGADALVLIAGPDKYPGGKFVEAGYAIGLGKEVYTVGRVENGILYCAAVEHATSAPHLIDLLTE